MRLFETLCPGSVFLTDTNYKRNLNINISVDHLNETPEIMSWNVDGKVEWMGI